MIPYDITDDLTVTPVTVHATTRQQVAYRIKSGRFQKRPAPKSPILKMLTRFTFALRCIVAPEPFTSEAEAAAEIELLQADVLKDRLNSGAQFT